MLTRFRAAQVQSESMRGDEVIRPDVPLRRWHQHDAWGLLRLYDACTPKRVQLAEGLTNDELVHTRAAGGRTWCLPPVGTDAPWRSSMTVATGSAVGCGCAYGRGAQPHMLSADDASR